MLFHTWLFLAFFLLFYPADLLLRGTRFRNLWIVAASYVFYGWWTPWFPLLLIWVTTVDYLAVTMMSRSTRRALWLWVSIGSDLLLLGFFKYGLVLTAHLNRLLAAGHAPFSLPEPNVLLPIGISFYVFQSMGHTLDCYHHRIEREEGFIRYAAFVAFFPLLLAGPIERAGNLLPQLSRRPAFAAADLTDGLSLFVVGLFKKVALADYLALYVDHVYAAPGEHQAAALIVATCLYSWQIYFDFSGYSDMARGTARMIGIRVMMNFDNPYMATGLGDFWRRWHISLSTWIRDYLFLPVYYRLSRRATPLAVPFITADGFAFAVALSGAFLAMGLWHGASWTFVTWGALHALGRLATRNLETSRYYRSRVPRFVKRLGVFAFVSMTWVVFRSATMGDAAAIVSRIFSTGWADPQVPVLMILLVVLVVAYEAAFESRRGDVLEWRPLRVALVAGMMLYIGLFTSATSRAFIYFQF